MWVKTGWYYVYEPQTNSLDYGGGRIPRLIVWATGEELEGKIESVLSE